MDLTRSRKMTLLVVTHDAALQHAVTVNCTSKTSVAK